MLTPVVVTSAAVLHIMEDDVLTGMSLSGDDSGGCQVRLNGNIIGSLAASLGSGTTCVACFIPLKISLKKGMLIQVDAGTVVLYFQ